MYVKKFEADTLDEALKSVKKELGPDAIILKTASNKGLKGALRKKVMVTAAISERNYGKKSKVDQILTDDVKEKFYKNPSSEVSRVIESYDNKENQKIEASYVNQYGDLALNKVVRTLKERPDLDSFLSGNENDNKFAHEVSLEPRKEKNVSESEKKEIQPSQSVTWEDSENDLTEEIVRQGERIYSLEKKLQQLKSSGIETRENELKTLCDLRITLKTLQINEKFIQKMLKRAHFELNDEEIKDEDVCYDFSLREMAENIKIQLPRFSTVEEGKGVVVTILLSETCSGQTSVGMKLAAMKTNSVVIKYGGKPKNYPEENVSATFFGITVVEVYSVSELISQIRTQGESGKSIFVDYKNFGKELDETKTMVEGIKRAFPHVETLLCLSGIHSDVYNRKVVAKYKALVNGLVISHFDLCLSYGEVFNIQYEYEIPLVFFGTGPVIPDDLEAASGERLLSR